MTATRRSRETASDSHTFVRTYHEDQSPTIVFVHGFRGTHHGLDRVAQHLPHYKIISPDLPGFGETKPLDAHTLDDYVEWLHRFITTEQRLVNTPPILLGHSFGSIIASAYAARFPDTVERLILVNPIGAPALEGPKGVLSRLALLYYQIGEKLPGKLAHTWLGAKPFVFIMTIAMTKTRDKQLRAFIHEQHNTHFSSFYSAQTVSEAFRAATINTVRDHAAHIPHKTLLVAGQKDDVTPLDKQIILSEKFPNAQLRVIDNTGHLLHYETPAEAAAFIHEFITSS